MITDAQWLGLAIRSESDQPHEWLPIGWVIRNRVLSRSYPNTYPEVILQRRQFSYFNKWRDDGTDATREVIYSSALAGYAGDSSGWSENNLSQAEQCARWLCTSPRWEAPFGPDVLHYWSPVSMVPRGSDPSWARTMEKVYVSGVDPWRFTFARPKVDRGDFAVTV